MRMFRRVPVYDMSLQEIVPRGVPEVFGAHGQLESFIDQQCLVKLQAEGVSPGEGVM